MPFTIDLDTGDVGYVESVCPYCGEEMYDSGCAAPGCAGFGCPDCGHGCDVDFVPDEDSQCARALAELGAGKDEDSTDLVPDGRDEA